MGSSNLPKAFLWNQKPERFPLFEAFHYSFRDIQNILGSHQNFHPTNEILFSSITNSSLESKPGSLFIPLIAERDGHEFITSAIANGAVGFLCNQGHPILEKLPSDISRLAIEVEDTWSSLGILASYHRNRFSPILIGITGSSGKTTTKELLATTFSHFHPDEILVTEKNYNNEIGVPFTIFGITDRTKFAILEMGMNHRGEIEKLTKIANPSHCLITNIGSAHIENLKSPEAIAKEKSEIVLGMKSPGKLFLPDDIAYKEIVQETVDSSFADIIHWNVNSNENGLVIHQASPEGFRLSWRGIQFDWKHPGEKILSNLSGVLHIASFLGMDDKTLVSNVQKYHPKGSRLNILSTDHWTLIDDTYNANPESMMSSISVAKQMSDGRPILCILGDMKELGDFSEHYHRMVGGYASQMGIDFLLSYGKDAEWIIQSFLESNSQSESKPKSKSLSISPHHFSPSQKESLDEIKKWIENNLPPGSVILVKGSRSMKMESIVEKILETHPTP